MILLFRILLAVMTSPFRRRLALFDRSVVRFRVLPNDVDVNFHMNNGRYLTMMDLGRFDLIARNGIFRALLRRRWFPVVGSATIRFIRSLGPLVRYELHTEMVGWDEKWFYLRQRFVYRGEVMAVGIIKGLFQKKGQKIAPADVVAAAGYPVTSPPLPQEVIEWQRAESVLTRNFSLEKDLTASEAV
jgi:acyl-CoA thioesterase FadM